MEELTPHRKEKTGVKCTRKEELMQYRKDRTETLTIRLTAEEKRLIKARATARRISLTDYILLSSLEYSDTDCFLPVLKLLGDIKGELLNLQRKDNSAAVYDVLVKQREVFDEIIATIKRR